MAVICHVLAAGICISVQGVEAARLGTNAAWKTLHALHCGAGMCLALRVTTAACSAVQSPRLKDLCVVVLL